MERYNVTAISLATQSEPPLTIEADESETTDDILLSAKIDNTHVCASNDGYFAAFQELRDKLLQRG